MAAHYPEEWEAVPASDSASGCEPIIDQFEQMGTAALWKGPFWDASTEEKPATLTSLTDNIVVPYDAVTHVSLNLSAEKPSMAFWMNKELLRTHNFQPGELDCESGFWKIEQKLQALPSSGIFLDLGATFSNLLLKKLTDGAIIISRKEVTVGTAMLLPLYLRGQTWYRFPPYKKRTEGPDPNAPYGAISDESKFLRLLPPPTQKNRNDNYEAQKRCLKSAQDQFHEQGDTLTTEAQKRLAGKSTQAFLYQKQKNADPFFTVEYINRAIGWTPSTRHAQLRKPHWLHPDISDRYVLCLLDAGYVWEEAERTE